MAGHDLDDWGNGPDSDASFSGQCLTLAAGWVMRGRNTQRENGAKAAMCIIGEHHAAWKAFQPPP